MQQARAELDTIGRRLEKQYPDSNDKVGVSFLPLHEYIVGDIRPVLLVLLAAVVIVLLIGCAERCQPSSGASHSARQRNLDSNGSGSEPPAFAPTVAYRECSARVVGRSPRVSAGSPGRSVAVGTESAGYPPVQGDWNQPGSIGIQFPGSQLLCGVVFGLIPALQSSRSNPKRIPQGRRTREHSEPGANPFRSGDRRSWALASSAGWSRAAGQEFRTAHGC